MDEPSETSFIVRTAQALYQFTRFVLEKIKKGLSEVYELSFKVGELAPYISFFVIISIIIVIILFATGAFGKNKNLKDIKKSFKPITSTFKRAFKFVIPGSNKKVEGIPRIVEGGRCDMINWKDTGKFCRKSSKPNDIIWTLDISDMDELNMLPQEVQDKLIENRLEIRIPYTLAGIKYIPDCSKMTYSDGTPAKLFKQQKLSDKICYFVDKESKKYV